ncbi:MAG TPA: allophanate hydrolase [Micropepsaceae bacterium]|nr:allophanate hydrolase [Micropepsaceae bacterium]
MKSLSFDIASLREAYRGGEYTPADIARETLRRIEAYDDPAVWISRVEGREVLARAEALTREDPADATPLWGIPFAVKDNIDVEGLPTTAGCPAFAYTPKQNATVVARLLAAGAILVGKTNLDQFATGLVGTRSPYGAPRSVFDSRYVSGGSSSGSGVAVAAGLVSFALGTDTAGSGRVPAAYNNIVGLKPTKGLISTSGVVPACRSLDCVSIFTATTGDAMDVLRAAEGFDAADIYSRPRAAGADIPEQFRFGVLASADREFFGDDSSAKLYEEAIARLSSLGGTAIVIDYAPFRAAAELLYQGAWTGERLAAIREFMVRHEDAMDPSVRAIIAGARSLSAVDAFEGQYRLAAARRAADAEWARIDCLLLPTVPTQDTVEDVMADPIARNARLGLYTNFVNLLDCCAIAVPAGFRTNGLPFGVTLIAPAFCESALAPIADALHRAGKFGMGKARNAALSDASRLTRMPDAGRVDIFVVGAHLSGMPLNHELLGAGGVLRGPAQTTVDYRLYVLPRTNPAKPGMMRDPKGGARIAGEIWSLSAEAFGRFVAKIPAPLGIGKVALDNGQTVSGFVAESYAIQNATDITALGGWRAYMQSRDR